MAQLEVTSGGKLLLFLAGVAGIVTAIARLIIQPVLATWMFFTLGREHAKVRELITAVFKDDLAELARAAKEIRECQAEQGERLSSIDGYLRGRSE